MVCACIDIGSNTTRLLAAEPDGRWLREIVQERAYTELRRGAVTPEAVARTAAVVAGQAARARAAGARTIRAVATAALREAPNRAELCAAIGDAAGVEVEVLDGEEEARLAFAGATGLLDPGPGEQVGVVDVGGASTELVCGRPGDGVTWAASLPVGSGVLADAWLISDPPAPGEVAALREHVAATLARTACPAPSAAYAVGGSARSVCHLVGDELTPATLDRGLDLLCAVPAAEAARRFALAPERVRVLPAGILLLAEAARAFGVGLGVAPGGLREGVVLQEFRTTA